MFHSLFKHLFNVRLMEEENPDAPGSGGEPPVTTEAPVEQIQDQGEQGNPSGEESLQEEPPATEEVELFYGDSTVEIEIPDDLSSELSAKGLDAKSLANELYRKDGNFTLTDETKQKLDGIYGKFAVDAFLSSLKTQNDAFLKGAADNKAAAEQADATRFSEIAELVGGEAGWDKLTAWGNENLSDQEIDDLNQVMQSGNAGLQRYAVQMLANKQRAAEGDPSAVLIQGESPAAAEGGALSAEAYRQEFLAASKTFKGDKRGYQQAVSKLDARRRAGMAKGI